MCTTIAFSVVGGAVHTVSDTLILTEHGGAVNAHARHVCAKFEANDASHNDPIVLAQWQLNGSVECRRRANDL